MNLQRKTARLFVFILLLITLTSLVTTQLPKTAAHNTSSAAEEWQRQAPLDIEEGLAYLYANQNGDGSWGGTAVSLNGIFPTTSDVVQALRQLEQTPTISQTNGIQYLANETVAITPFYADRVLSLVGTGQDITADLNTLLARQNADGGWGTLPNTPSNIWDTALAMAALKAGGVSDQAVYDNGLFYLVWQRNGADWGWGLMRGEDSHVFYTALVLNALNAHDATYDLSGIQNTTIAFLRSQQQADSGYGSPDSTPFETALVLQAILQSGQPLTPAEQQAIAYLEGQQAANGSWLDDPYSTALALRALSLPPDSDGDGMTDACETLHGLNPNDPADAALDNDGDGLLNRQECDVGTDPNVVDTDVDTVDDFTEVRCLSDPLDNADFNRPPQITSPPVRTVAAGQGYGYGVTAVDPDNDPLTYNLLNAPPNMMIDASGFISWTADISQTGQFPVVVAASDGGCDDVQPFGLAVLAQGVDLVVTTVNADALDIDLTTLVVIGSVQVGVQNVGGSALNGRFDITLFEDLDNNTVYSSTDQLLGSSTYSGTIQSDETITLTIQAAGVMQFRDNLVYGWVDSRAEIPELDESNNIAHSGQRSQYQPVRDWLPVVEWEWNAPSSEWLGGVQPPTVAPLIDTNGDGLINEQDVPAVIMVTNSVFNNGRLQALRGDTGEVIFTVPAPGGGNFSVAGHTPAVGDLDSDGLPEIAIVTFNNINLFVFNNDGTLKWQATPGTSNSSNVAIADLDGDGQSEVIANMRIFNADGTLHAIADDGLTGYWDGYGGGRHVADLDMDGDGEIVAGPSVYDKDGNIVWYWRYNFQVGNEYQFQYSLDGGQTISTTLLPAPFGDGWTSVANVDSDPYPEIILTDKFYETLIIFDHDGQIHAGPWQLFTDIFNTVSYELGGTAVADFDGDGQVEIAFSVNRLMWNNTFAAPSNITLLLYETDGTLIWEKEMFYEKVINQSPVPTAFDFDGDGIYEILFLDRQRFTIVDGVTSDTLYETAINRVNDGWPIRYPVVADVDNDGNAEVLVPTYFSYQVGTPTRNGLIVLGDANDNWPNSRRLWNQWQYDASNVNEDGSIPTTPEANWLTHNTVRAQQYLPGLGPFAAPDLTVSRVTFNSDMCPASADITARIGNGGNLHVAAGQTVNFYDDDPLAGGTFITQTMTTQAIYPGEFEDVTIDWSAPANSQVYVTINETITNPLVSSANLAQLPHTTVDASGMCTGCVMVFNGWAFRGIDGNLAMGWVENWGNSGDIDPRPPYYEVTFPFPVNASVVTVTNNYADTGFLTGTLSLSNGFTTTFAFDATGSGVITFPGQQDVSWLKLTATDTKVNGASLNELEVGGSYREPVSLLREGVGRMSNNGAMAGFVGDPCNPPANQPPQVVSVPIVTVDVTQVYSYSVTAVDPDLDPLTYTLLDAPTGMTIDSAGLITWNPNVVVGTAVSVTVEVADTGNLTDTQSFVVDVLIDRDINHAPSIVSTPPLTVSFGSSYSYDVAATDADGDWLLFDLLTGPAGMMIESDTGLVSWAPTEAQLGQHVVMVAAQDAVSQTTQAFVVTVTSMGIPMPPGPIDEDGDGWIVPADCDDTNELVNPGQVEIPGNGLDDDCNPATLDVVPQTAVSCQLFTTQQAYLPDDLIQLRWRIQNVSQSLDVTGLSGTVSVADGSGQTVFSQPVVLQSLPPGGMQQGTIVVPMLALASYEGMFDVEGGLCGETVDFAVTLPPPENQTTYLPFVMRQ